MNQDRIISKIQALMRKTIENGATEEEAICAAQKAREMMDKYQVAVTLDETKEHGATEAEIKSKTRRRDQSMIMSSAIARYCDCTVLYRGNLHVIFVGAPDDAEMASALYVMLRETKDGEWAKFRKSPAYNQAIIEATGNPNVVFRQFCKSYGIRINQRLMELAQQRETQQVKSTGTALVVVKQQLIDEYMTDKYPSLRKSRAGRLRKSSSTARVAGYSAANRATINKPIK